jgi:BlaI family transcriptional regulator, penicillinase repressor
MVMPKPKIDITESEWFILKVLWEQEPMTAPAVTEALQSIKGWAYTTVRTMMDRMLAKGLLKSEKVRHIDFFRPAVTRKQAQQAELLDTMKRAFNNALTPMMQCLIESRDLSAEELGELEAILEAKRKGAKK